MPDAKTFFADPLRFFIALVGEPGAGKTRQAATFPKIYAISIGDSYGFKTVLEDPKNVHLRKNLIWHEALDLATKGEARDIFKVTDDPDTRTSLYGCIAHAKAMAAKGEVETLVLDGLSFLADFKGVELGKTSGNTEGDRWAYFRQLKNDLTWLMNTGIMPLVSRHKLSVVITMHLQRQDDEMKQRQASQEIDLLPRIEGGYRNAISGIPRAMIYLHQNIKVDGANQKLEYLAFCQKVRVNKLGVIPAKNDYGLPPTIDLTGKNLYDVLVQSMTAAAPRTTAAQSK